MTTSSSMHIICNIILISVVVSLSNGQHNPNFKHNRRAIVQLFEWKFDDIANECETFLGKNNFAGVQVRFCFRLGKVHQMYYSFIHGIPIRYHQ